MSDSECDSVEEIITVRPLPIPRVQVQRNQDHHHVAVKQFMDPDSGRGSVTAKDSFRDAATSNFPPIIPLNVGGHIYMTRLSTLLKYSDSMLAAMFSGRHQVDTDKQGNYFLDTNGFVFGQILEFLRNGTLPTKDTTLAVYRDANYYGLNELVEKLNLRPDIASLTVREAQRALYPNYGETKDLVVRTAIANAAVNRIGEVNIYAFRKEFLAKAHNFNNKHQCIVEQAHVVIGPWEGEAEEETLIRCIETDLQEEGYNVKPHEPKRKCRYYMGQTCQKFVYKIGIIFE